MKFHLWGTKLYEAKYIYRIKQKKKKIDHSIVEYIRIQTKLLCYISLLKVILGVN